MNTATCKALIVSHFSITPDMPDVTAKDIKRVRKVKDTRGRNVRLFRIGEEGGGAVVITDAPDTLMLDIVVLDNEGLDDLDDCGVTLKEGYQVWDWELRVGSKPLGYNNDLTPDLFYFCFFPEAAEIREPHRVDHSSELLVE